MNAKTISKLWLVIMTFAVLTLILPLDGQAQSDTTDSLQILNKLGSNVEITNIKLGADFGFLPRINESALEPSTVIPGDLTVCSLGADFITIQDAIDAAIPGDEIGICPGTFSENLTIDKDVILSGYARIDTIIDGRNLDWTIKVQSNAKVTINALTIRNGDGNVLVTVDSHLSMDNAFIKGSYAGGGIRNEGGGLFLNDTWIIENGTAGHGGGILNIGGSVSILNESIVSNNNAGSDSSNGGGIYNTDGGELTIINSKVDKNSATGDAAGGVYNDASSTMTITHSSVNLNQLDGRPGCSGRGIFNAGQMLLTASEVAGNTYESSSNDCRGGGIYNSGQLNIVDSTIQQNDVGNSGGGLYNSGTTEVVNSLFYENEVIDNAYDDFAFMYGGGIYNSGSISLTTTNLTANRVYAAGGGIYNSSSGAVTLYDSHVEENRVATSGSGAGIFNLGSLIIENSTIHKNNGSYFPDIGLDASGGGLHNEGTATLRRVNIRNNDTYHGSGSLRGGGIFNSGTLLVEESMIVENVSGNGNGVYNAGQATVNASTFTGNHGPGSGGAISNSNELTLTNSTISGNIGYTGSGIQNWNGNTTINNSTIANNEAEDDGGSVHNYNGTITFANTIIANTNAQIECVGIMTSNGYNRDRSGTCHLNAIGDVDDVEVNIGTLGDNGGPTLTHALLPGSSAIDRGDCTGGTVAVDQRGVMRPQGASCDIGAYEADGSEPPNNHPPIVHHPGDQTNFVGDEVLLDIDASDIDGDLLTFRAERLPPGLSIDSTTGIISGILTVSSHGTYKIIASDGDNEGYVIIDWRVSIRPVSCGPLVQEDGEYVDKKGFSIGSDSNASGGTYIYMRDTDNVIASSADSVDLIDSKNYVDYCFGVTEADTYLITGWVYAQDGRDNSFFVTVDGLPASGYLWDIPINTGYIPDEVNTRGGADPVEIDLLPGNHTVRIYSREDGARLDKIALVAMNGNKSPSIGDPGDQYSNVGDNISLIISATDADKDMLTFTASLLPTGLNIDSVTGKISGILTEDSTGRYNVTLIVSDGISNAEVSFTWTISSEPSSGCGELAQEAENGILFGKMEVGDDPNASGGQFIHLPDPAIVTSVDVNTINSSSVLALSHKHRADFCVTVIEAGEYRIRTQVMAPDHRANSFFVQIDGRPNDGYIYDIYPVGSSYIIDYVNDRYGVEPIVFSLNKGDHTVSFILREDGTRLDSFVLEPIDTKASAVHTPSINEVKENQIAENAISDSTEFERKINLFVPMVIQ